ncbi:hypothetical protein L1987_03632 [Smallanthus sonchifolius]|uniref:Uncharacterized protein n=1 Tax=Smallanthus sonchifolius TaxID=185202 RepID=A0ACB9KB74_9ASTR|nr:hypothetical protein L1987_03632 [Smallanthus sonchifolius]
MTSLMALKLPSVSSGVPPTPAHSSISFSSKKFFLPVGSNIEVDGALWKVLEFLHVKPGKGAAYVRTTLKSYITGNSVEKTFRAGSKIEQAEISKEAKQFTYKDGSQFVFMDLSSYEEVRLNESDMGDDEMAKRRHGLQLPISEWEGYRFRASITGGSKPATVETGAVVYVPLFVDRSRNYCGYKNRAVWVCITALDSRMAC